MGLCPTLSHKTSEAFRWARGMGIYILPPGQSHLPFYLSFIFWSFILHLLLRLLCFNLCSALTTTRLWFVLPLEFPLVPLVSSNTHFFSFFSCEIFPVHNRNQKASRKTAAFKQLVNHLFATHQRSHRKSNQRTKLSDTYHLSKTFFSGR